MYNTTYCFLYTVHIRDHLRHYNTIYYRWLRCIVSRIKKKFKFVCSLHTAQVRCRRRRLFYGWTSIHHREFDNVERVGAGTRVVPVLQPVCWFHAGRPDAVRPAQGPPANIARQVRAVRHGRRHTAVYK